MKDPQILSTFEGHGPRRKALPVAQPLVFDACQVSVILRAVLYVEAVLAVALGYAQYGWPGAAMVATSTNFLIMVGSV